jgi:hypothetical protein
VATAVVNSKSANKTVEEYFKDLENIKSSENKPIISAYIVFITMLSFTKIAMCYCLFKFCFVPSHSVKPLFPMYKPRDWSRKS